MTGRLRSRLGWALNDLGFSLLGVSRRVEPLCPDVDHPTLRTFMSGLDQLGLKLSDVAVLAESRKEAAR
ncbi:hypothetical protein GCM10009814_14740 [Lapillicoccus jejuensis]|uniref:Uncharacterized protein n=1 Tax=Lapillicoccus jejuensis TaxID=402171 RepID=A0A542DVW4_9MICO|nr:hypothetical protein FB458_0296 [Lapillicoccus jejuensis]